MSELSKISIEDLSILKDLYKVDYPLHISTYQTIQLFIERFAKHPNWLERVSFWSCGDSWKVHGHFIMFYSYRIYFNTLEAFPFPRLKQTLLLAEFTDKTTFVNIRSELRQLTLDMVRIHHFQIVSDVGTKSFLLPKQMLLDMKFE